APLQAARIRLGGAAPGLRGDRCGGRRPRPQGDRLGSRRRSRAPAGGGRHDHRSARAADLPSRPGGVRRRSDAVPGRQRDGACRSPHRLPRGAPGPTGEGVMSWAVWITGLPGSGKSVIARAVADTLHAGGAGVRVLELDAIRRVITPAATYTDAEREAAYRALVYIGACLVDAGIPVIFDATAHRRAWRELARATLPRFAEVQLHCPLEVCRRREAVRPRGAAPAGIYAQATRPGAHVPGVNVEYEFARAPELWIDTSSQTVQASAAVIVDMIRGRFLGSGPGAAGAARADEAGPDRTSILAEGADEQREISRRARRYAAGLVHDEIVGRRRSRSFIDERERMVEWQIAGRGIRDPAVLAAMRKVPREHFVAGDRAHRAYDDTPLPIGEGQTISQPYIVAAMTEALRLRPGDRVLEIGTGSGYAAAVLALI